MASTNKTTNYDLSQYIGTDKPTYLTDYNQDMSKIDAGIHAAKSEADTNASAIGTLSSLTTTAKTSCVAAINEVDADVATNTNNIATNTSNIATNTTHIGTVANLTTASKTDLVSAANEINAKVGNIANLTTNDKTSTVAAINEVNYNVGLLNLTTVDEITSSDITVTNGSAITNETHLKVAYNADKSLAKVYGTCKVRANSGACTISFSSSLRPSSNITINNVVSLKDTDSFSNSYFNDESINIATDGTISFTCWNPSSGSHNAINTIVPVLIFVTDFGDEPLPPQV